MALTVTSLGITFNTTAGAKTVTATPAVGDIIVVVGANTGNTTAQTPTLTDNNTDGHGTYVRIPAATSTKNTSADSMFVLVRADSIQKAVSTTWTYTPGATDTGGGCEVFKVTGMALAAASAVRQAAVQNNGASSGTPAPVLGVAALTGNALIGAVFNGSNPATMTAPTSWTESNDTGYNTPVTGLETVFRNSGFTGTTVTWGSTSTGAFCAVVVELSAALSINSVERPPWLNTQAATQRAATWMKAAERGWRRNRAGLLVPQYA